MAGALEILSRVHDALRREPIIEAASHVILLDFEDGVLTIEGEVGSIAAKKLALERAAAQRGVSALVDRLHFARARSMTDDEIRSHTCEMLAAELAFFECTILSRERGRVEVVRTAVVSSQWTIEVSVDEGVVTLDGDAPSLAHKRLAGVMAFWVPGSRDVVNGLGVLPPEEDSDEEVNEGVRLALEKDPFLDAVDIRSTVQRRVVTLRGVAHSDAQKEMAEMDAWAVFGVDFVVNELVVREARAQPQI
ncbi:MAG: BON domain-containing protein [Deltaproteobacteria bacterium]|nr:BON domain-containing protein [Deltaproteobacteria bacterium]